MLMKKVRGRLAIKLCNTTGLPLGLCKKLANTYLRGHLFMMIDHVDAVEAAGGLLLPVYGQHCEQCSPELMAYTLQGAGVKTYRFNDPARQRLLTV